MTERQGISGPQFHADRPVEQEAVRTTIVGGRPPGSGKSIGQIPRGIEILVKKASVDPDFKELLLAKRADAAEEIGLKLDPAETMMLVAVPARQLETIIARTSVPQEHRRAFLGKAAVAMLAAVSAAGAKLAAAGIADYNPGSRGARPDRPPAAMTIEQRVISLIARQISFPPELVTAKSTFADDLKISPQQSEAISRALQSEFGLTITAAALAKFRTVGDLIDHVEMATDVEPKVIAIIAKRLQVPPPEVTPEASLVDDLKATARQFADLRQDLLKSFDVYIPWTAFKAAGTVGEVVACTGAAVKRRRDAQAKQRPQPYEIPSPVTRGSRPNPPPPYGSFGIRPEPPRPGPSDWRGGIGGIRPGSSR